MSNSGERVVKAYFDNQEFEKNIKQSIKSLDDFENALKLKDASDGMDEVIKSVRSMSDRFEDAMSSMKDGLSSVGDHMSSFGHSLEKIGDAVTLKGTAIRKIISNLVDDVEKKIKSLFKEISDISFGSVKAGFSEYELKIGSVQTILANVPDTNLKAVSQALDELNHYADKTIYNFAQMTANIGRFTAAGVGLQDSVDAIKGISNLAAFSGANAAQASNIMFQAAQAMSAGVFLAMDWRSFVNSSMGGKTFQDLLVQMATKMGKTAEKTVETTTTDKKGKQTTKKTKATVSVDQYVAEKGFRNSLAAGWLTSDVMLNVLRVFSGEMTDAELKALGFSDQEIKKFLEIGETATEAATKVRTFTQLFDTLKEAMQSGWTQTWEILIGDFDEATELLTNINNVVSAFVQKTADARNNLLQAWKDIGGRTQLIADLSNAVDLLIMAGSVVKSAFEDVFRFAGIDAKAVKAFTDNFGNAVQRVKDFFLATREGTYSGSILFDLGRGVRGFFAAIEGAINVLKTVGGILKVTIWPVIESVAVGVASVIAKIGDVVYRANENLKRNKTFEKFVSLIRDRLAPGIQRATDSIRDFFNNFRSKFLDFGATLEASSGIATFLIWIRNAFSDAVAWIKNAIATISAEAPRIFSAIREGFGNAVEWIKNAFNSVKNSINGFSAWIGPIIDSIKNKFRGLFANKNPGQEKASFFERIVNVLKNMGASIKAFYYSEPVQNIAKQLNSIKKRIADAVQGWFTGGGFDRFVDGTIAISKNVFKALSSLVTSFKNSKLFAAVKDFIKNIDFAKIISQLKGVFTSVKGFGGSIISWIVSLFTGGSGSGSSDEQTIADKVRAIKKASNGIAQFSASAEGLVGQVSDAVGSMGKKMSGTSSLFENVKGFFSGIATSVSGFFGAIDFSKLLSNAEGIIQKITALAAPIVLLRWVNSFSKVNKGIAGSFKEFAQVVKGFRGLGGEFTGIGEVLKGTIKTWGAGGLFGPIQKVLAGEKGSVGSLLTQFGENGGIMAALVKVFGDKTQTQETVQVLKKVDSIGTTVLKFAAAIGIIVGAVYLLANVINQDNLNNALTALGLIVVGFAAFIGVMALIQKKVSGANIIADSALKFAGALAAIAAIIYLISKIEMTEFETGGTRLAILAGGLSAFMLVIALINRIANPKGFISMAVGIFALIAALKILAAFTNEEFIRGGYKLALLLIVFSGAMAVAGMGNGAKGAFSFSVAILVLLIALKTLSKMKIEQIAQGVVGLMAVMLTFSLFLNSIGKGDKLGKTKLTGLLGFSLALTTLAKCIKTIGEMELWDAVKGVAAVSIIIGMMTLMLNKGATDGETKVKGLIGMAVALVALIIPLRTLAVMNWEEYIRAVGGITILIGMMTLLMQYGATDSDKKIKGLFSLAIALVAMIIPLKALAAMDWEQFARAIGGLILTMGVIALVFREAAKINNSKSLTGLTIGLVAVAGIMYLLTVVFDSVKDMEWADALVRFGGVALVFAAMAAVFAAASKVNNWTSIGGMAIGIVLLGGVIYVLGEVYKGMKDINPDTLTASMWGIIGVLGTMALIVGILGNFSGDIGHALTMALGIAVMTGAVIGICYALNLLKGTDVSGLPETLSSISMLLITMGGIVAVLGGLATLTGVGWAAGAAAAVNILEFVVIIGAALYGLGKLAEALPDLMDNLALGGDIMELVGQGLFKLVKGILSLDELAQDLVKFMTDIQPFITACQAITPEMFTGLDALIGAVVKIADGQLESAIVQFLLGEDPIKKFTTQITSLGSGLGLFNYFAGKINSESITAAVGLIESLTGVISVPESPKEIGDALTSAGAGLQNFGTSTANFKILPAMSAIMALKAFVGSKDAVNEIAGYNSINGKLSEVGAELAQFSDSFANISDSTINKAFISTMSLKRLGTVAKDIEGVDVTSFNDLAGVLSLVGGGVQLYANAIGGIEAIGEIEGHEIDAIDMVTRLIKAIPEDFTSLIERMPGEEGPNGIGTFSAGMVALGGALIEFANSTKDVDQGDVEKAVSCIDSLGKVYDSLPKVGGLVANLFGEVNPYKFSSGLRSLGTGLKAFYENTQELDKTKIEDAASCLDSLSTIEAKLVPHGGWIQQIFGDSNFTTFGTGLSALGAGLAGFAESAGGVTAEGVSGATDVIAALAEIEKALKSHNGLQQWLDGDQTYDEFAVGINALGGALNQFNESIKDLDVDKVKAVTSIVDELALIEGKLRSHGGVAQWFTGDSNLETFSDDVSKLGDGLKAFNNKVADITQGDLDYPVSVAKSLADVENKLRSHGGIAQWFTGDNSFSGFASGVGDLGSALKAFSDNVVGINKGPVDVAVDVTKDLNQMEKNLHPKQNAIFAWFTGEDNLTSFGGRIKALGECLASFTTSIADISTTKSADALTVAKDLNSMESNLHPHQNELFSWFTGSDDLSSFGGRVKSLGECLGAFSTSIANLDVTKANDAVTVSKNLVDIDKNLGNKSNKLFNWFTGEYTLDSFGSDIEKLGGHLAAFANSTDGITFESVSGGIDAVSMLSKIAAALPEGTSNDLKNWFEGNYSLGSFTAQLPGMAGNLAEFTGAMADVDLAAFEAFAKGMMYLAYAGKIGLEHNTESFDALWDMLYALNSSYDLNNQMWLSAFQNGSEIVTQINSGMTSSVPDLTKTINGIGLGVKTTFEGWIPSLVDAGKFYVAGLSSGIGDKTQTSILMLAVDTLAEKVEAELRKVWGIKSPSKVAYEDGFYFVKGLTDALEDRVPAAKSASSNLASETLTGFEEIFGEFENPIVTYAEEGMSALDELGLTGLDVAGTLGTAFTAAGNTISGIVGDAASDLTSVVSTAIKPIISSTSDIAQSFNSMFSTDQLSQLIDLVHFGGASGMADFVAKAKTLIGGWSAEGLFNGSLGDLDLQNLFNLLRDDKGITTYVSTITAGTPLVQETASEAASEAAAAAADKVAKTGKYRKSGWYVEDGWWTEGDKDFSSMLASYKYYENEEDIPEKYRAYATYHDATTPATTPAVEETQAAAEGTQQAAEAATVAAEASLGTAKSVEEILGMNGITPAVMASEYAGMTATEIATLLGLIDESEITLGEKIDDVVTGLAVGNANAKAMMDQIVANQMAVASLASSVANMDIYLDTGGLVGHITPLINVSLGELFNAAKR